MNYKTIRIIYIAIVTGIVLTGAGIYVSFTHTRPPQAQQVTPSSLSQNTQPIATPAVDFPVPELGITLQLSKELAEDLVYKVVQPSLAKNCPPNDDFCKNVGLTVKFGSKTLAKEKQVRCRISTLHWTGPIGTIIKSTKLFTEDWSFQRDPVEGVDIKFGNYYLTFIGPQEGCSDNLSVNKFQSDESYELRTAWAHIQSPNATPLH